MGSVFSTHHLFSFYPFHGHRCLRGFVFIVSYLCGKYSSISGYFLLLRLLLPRIISLAFVCIFAACFISCFTAIILRSLPPCVSPLLVFIPIFFLYLFRASLAFCYLFALFSFLFSLHFFSLFYSLFTLFSFLLSFFSLLPFRFYFWLTPAQFTSFHSLRIHITHYNMD